MLAQQAKGSDIKNTAGEEEMQEERNTKRKKRNRKRKRNRSKQNWRGEKENKKNTTGRISERPMRWRSTEREVYFNGLVCIQVVAGGFSKLLHVVIISLVKGANTTVDTTPRWWLHSWVQQTFPRWSWPAHIFHHTVRPQTILITNSVKVLTHPTWCRTEHSIFYSFIQLLTQYFTKHTE